MYPLIGPEFIPTDDFWESIRQGFECMRTDFETLTLENEPEARKRKFASTYDDHTLRPDTIGVIRYRRSDDLANLALYFDVGSQLCEELEEQIARRDTSSEFILKWGILCFCHGFVCNSAFATGSETGNKYAGHRSALKVEKRDKKKWVAALLKPLLGSGIHRATAEVKVAKLVRDLKANPGNNYKVEWLTDLLSSDGQLKMTYRARDLPEEAFDELLSDESLAIPPVKQIS